ncbi:helix-turn-helix domain-containing protein [Flammeovirga sp. EKP202]|uniref:helix-turn-helix domain-containing protein n=1 Tax=Flammeovirga sp. EKP202 TaxID=2770592 RepID=UPI00165F6329|nr:helix-turn-helix domain-containing protein [Flammeovirga sp. EKP202]
MKLAGLTLEEFAVRFGVALTVIRKIEQGKTNLNLDKVNFALRIFNLELLPVNSCELKEKLEMREVYSEYLPRTL